MIVRNIPGSLSVLIVRKGAVQTATRGSLQNLRISQAKIDNSLVKKTRTGRFAGKNNWEISFILTD